MIKTILAYALNSEKKLVHIDSVKNGLECGCVCPGCKEKLIAKNDGKIRDHHFAHASNKECITGYQTMIHLLAKDIIEEMKILPMPCKGKLLAATDVYKEVAIKEFGFIPDILAYSPLTDGSKIVEKIPVIIEIFVTHPVDDDKKNKIIMSGIPAMEIDLSKVEFTTKEDLILQIYNPKNWKLINSKIGHQYLPRIQIPTDVLAYLYKQTAKNSQPTGVRRYPRYRNYYKNRRF